MLATLFKECTTISHAHDVSEKTDKSKCLKGAEQKKGTHAVQQMLLVTCGIMFVSLDLPLKIKCIMCIYFFFFAHDESTSS